LWQIAPMSASGWGHGRGGVALHRRDQLRAVGLDGRLDRLRREDVAPLRLDRHHFGAATLRDLDQEMPEAAEDRHQDLVTGGQERDQHRLDPRARRAVDQEGPPVLGLEDLPVEDHDLVHVLGELRVELPQELRRHRA
jgi:hypothetical protein